MFKNFATTTKIGCDVQVDVSVEVQVLPGCRVSTSHITTTTFSDCLSATARATMQGPPDTPHVPECVDATYPSTSWASPHDPGGGRAADERKGHGTLY